MEGPPVYSSGEGRNEVYYRRLTDNLALKITWLGEESFVPTIPTQTEAKSMPKPVADKMITAFRVVQELEKNRQASDLTS